MLDNDCVIVPALGGFMAHHVCARYCPDTHTFIPPSRQLGFNSQLQINDSLLAQSYIEAYDISYPEAIRRIDDEVSELRQKLQNDGSCELNDIGTLRLNSEGKIEFEPCEAGILTPNLYGLNTLDIKTLTDAVKPHADNQKPHKASSQKAQAATTIAPKSADDSMLVIGSAPQPTPELTVSKAPNDADDTIADDIEEEEEQEATISLKVSTLKYIGTIAAACIAMFICALPFGRSTQPELTKSYLDTGILYNILPADLRSPDSDKTIKHLTFGAAQPVTNDSITSANGKQADGNDATDEQQTSAEEQQNKEKQSAKETSTQPAEKPAEHFFSIVLASRVTKTNAQNFVNQLKQNGYGEAEVVTRSNGSKVIYGHFTTEDEARKYLREQREAAEAFLEAWVMKF